MRPDLTSGRTSPALNTRLASRSANASALLPEVVVALSGSHLSNVRLNASITTRFDEMKPGADPSGTPVGCGAKLASGLSSGRRLPVVSA